MAEQARFWTILKKTGKWTLRIVLALFALILVVWLLLQTQWAKNLVKNQAVAYLKRKLHTEISVGSIDVAWLNHIRLSDIYLEDQQKRPLASIGEIEAKYRIWSFLTKTMVIPEIGLADAQINLIRDENDSLFNFSFIPAAFSSGESSPDTSTGSTPLILKLGNIRLERIKFLMDDRYGGSRFEVSAHSIKGSIREFNTGDMKIDGDYLFTDSIRTAIRFTGSGHQSNASKTDDPPETGGDDAALTINMDSVRLANTGFSLVDEEGGTDIQTRAGLLAVGRVSYDLAGMNAKARSLVLRDQATTFSMKSNGGQETEPSETEETGEPGKPFTFAVASAEISRNQFQYDDNAYPQSNGSGTIDYHHLRLDNFNLLSDSIEYNGRYYLAQVRKSSVEEKSGFLLKQLQGKFIYSDTAVNLDKLLVEVNHSRIQGQASVSYPSLGELMKKPGETKLLASLTDTRIHPDDLFFFSPELRQNPSVQGIAGKDFYLDTHISGNLENLSIPDLAIRESQILLKARAKVSHPTDPKRLYIDLQLDQLSGTQKELLALLPPGTLPDSLQHYIPETFKISGTYNGTLDDFSANLLANTSEGNVRFKGKVSHVTDTKASVYDINVDASELEVGHILADSTYGAFTGSVVLKGRGWDPTVAEMNYDAKITQFEYNGYQYRDITATGDMRDQVINARIHSDDPNARLESNTTVGLKDGMSLKTETDISFADLQQLHFFQDSFQVKSRLVSDLTMDKEGKLLGTALLTGSEVLYKDQHVDLDTMRLAATDSADIQEIRLASPFADLSLRGHYALRDLPSAATTIANKYFYADKTDTVFEKRVVARLQLTAHHPQLVYPFIPGLKNIDPFSFIGVLSTDSSTLAFVSSVTNIEYQDYKIDTVLLAGVHMPSREEFRHLNNVAVVKGFTSPSIKVPGITVEADMVPGDIEGTVALLDSAGEKRYNFPYALKTDGKIPRLYLKDSLMIDRKLWKSGENDVIYLDMKAFGGSRLTISNGEEELSILSDSSQQSGLPVKLSLRQFRVANISNILLPSETPFADGFCNGTVTVNAFSPFRFASNLNIDSLQFTGVQAGNFKANVSQESGDDIRVDAGLSGYGNDLRINGSYNTALSKPEITLDINHLNAATVAPLLSPIFSDLHGGLHGNLRISGTTSKPEVYGPLNMDSLWLVYRAYNTTVLVPSSNILFEGNQVQFNDFTFYDSAGHMARLAGNIAITDGFGMALDLKATGKNFLVVGARTNADQQVYGPARADFNISINGSLERLLIGGNVTLAEKSELSYVYIPTDNASFGEGLIEFFDPSHPEVVDSTAESKEKKKAAFTYGLNMEVNVTPSSTVRIMLDEMTGDQLTLNGNANLNITQEPGGDMYLSGIYELNKGKYEMSIMDLVRKEFDIEDGSSITWNGDPLKANVDITAKYATRTTAGELLVDLPSADAAGRQQLDFEVYLILKHELLKPDISFRLDMAESSRQALDGAVYSRIQQINSNPADLNKQVIGLLAINHFIADNPFSSLSGGGGFANNVYGTAGQLITSQLSDLLNNAIKGVDISLELDSRENAVEGSSERNTNLKLGLSKSLANDRLSVYVGSTFALEGQNQSATGLNGLAGNVILEYLLTKSGKYRVRAFRTTDEDLTLEASIVKTGLSFVLVFEFNRTKNMFRVKRKKSTNEL